MLSESWWKEPNLLFLNMTIQVQVSTETNQWKSQVLIFKLLFAANIIVPSTIGYANDFNAAMLLETQWVIDNKPRQILRKKLFFKSFKMFL